MSQFPGVGYRDEFTGSRATERSVASFFNTVYAWMCVGLAVTAGVAWLVSQNAAVMATIYNRPIYFVLFLGSVAIAWGVGSVAHRISPTAATGLFLLYAALIGALISGIFLVYSMNTILSALLVTGGTFGGMSVYGFVTKRDLSRMGSILVMCFWGLLLASVVNFWVGNDALSWIITYGVLIVFIGLTAYDTQKLRKIAMQVAPNSREAAQYAIVGSLHLYIDFINIFLSILRIMGSRR